MKQARSGPDPCGRGRAGWSARRIDPALRDTAASDTRGNFGLGASRTDIFCIGGRASRHAAGQQRIGAVHSHARSRHRSVSKRTGRELSRSAVPARTARQTRGPVARSAGDGRADLRPTLDDVFLPPALRGRNARQTSRSKCEQEMALSACGIVQLCSPDPQPLAELPDRPRQRNIPLRPT
jgi:hypothetical protein